MTTHGPRRARFYGFASRGVGLGVTPLSLYERETTRLYVGYLRFCWRGHRMVSSVLDVLGNWSLGRSSKATSLS